VVVNISVTMGNVSLRFGCAMDRRIATVERKKKIVRAERAESHHPVITCVAPVSVFLRPRFAMVCKIAWKRMMNRIVSLVLPEVAIQTVNIFATTGNASRVPGYVTVLRIVIAERTKNFAMR